MLFWVPQLLLFGKDMFTTETPRIDSSYLLTGLFWGLAAVEMVIGVWTIVAFLKCLGEVQGFSAWRALGSVLLSILAILVPILGIVMVMVLVKQLMPH